MASNSFPGVGILFDEQGGPAIIDEHFTERWLNEDDVELFSQGWRWPGLRLTGPDGELLSIDAMTKQPTFFGLPDWNVTGSIVLTTGEELDYSRGLYLFGMDYKTWTFGPAAKRCNHSFVDTGMLRSWCKHCDKEALFNRSTGQYDLLVSAS